MKKILSISLCLIASGVWANLDYENYAVGQDPAAVTVTFASTPDSRGFTWFTTQDIASGEVAILAGTHGSDEDALFDASTLKITATKRAADDSGRPINVFTAKTYGLAAGGYSYRLGAVGHYKYGTFSVKASPTSLTVVNLSDAQTRDATRLWKWERSCQAVASQVGDLSDIDLIVNGGDHFDGAFLNAGDNTVTETGNCRYFQWAIATDAMNQYLAGVPMIWTSGNHDYYKDYEFIAEDWGVTNDYTYGCHSFDYGDVHIASVPYSPDWKGLCRDVLVWLERDLKVNKRRKLTKWTVVSTHAGPYTTGDNMRGNTYVTNSIVGMAALCAKYHVDLVLQAHDHTSSKTLPYRWDAQGWTTNANDATVVNLAPVKIEDGGELWDVDPNGTYYVSAGCAGHRIGELSDYADRTGKNSYTNRLHKIETATISVDSNYARKGDDASKDVNRMMFGVLRIEGDRLAYDWYAVNDEGVPELYDTLRVTKSFGDGANVQNETDFSQIPSAMACLDPQADDAGAKPTENRYWSFDGADTTVLPFAGEGVSRYVAMNTGAARLRRNFHAMSSAQAMDADPAPVALVTNATTVVEATVKFTAANGLPPAEADKFALFVYDGRLCALGGYADDEYGLVQKLYAFDVTADAAWLAASHRVRLETFAEVTTDAQHAGVVVTVDGEVASVSGAQDGYLGNVTIASDFQSRYAARQIVLSLKSGNDGRTLKGLAFAGQGELDAVSLSYVRKDIVPHPEGMILIVR